MTPDMRIVAPTVSRILGIPPPIGSTGAALKHAVDDLAGCERLAVVVIDALGEYTWDTCKDETPFFNRLRDMHHVTIESVMPSITPVNFTTMLTGASPEAHGITSRDQPLTHETIFDVLRLNGKRSATAARALSSLGILLSPHSDVPGVAESNTDAEVAEKAAQALSSHIDLVWVHLLDVDDAGHAHGPTSTMGKAAAGNADRHLHMIAEHAYRHGYCMITLADHGQHKAQSGPLKGTHGTTLPEDLQAPFIWAGNSELGEALNPK